MYKRKITREELLFELNTNKDVFEHKNGYFFLKGNSKLVAQRFSRVESSRKKLQKAAHIIRILSHIPTLKLIGISGSLSMDNAKKDDDIDLFFITSAHTLWISRILVLSVLIILKEKRGRERVIAKDRICPNMFLSETALSTQSNSRNIYVAHELSQLKVLYAKDNIYQKFLAANSWALSFLPNAFTFTKSPVLSKNPLLNIFIPLDYLLFFMQFLYMKKRITNEKIGVSFAMFHPLKSDSAVQEIYALKVKYWGAILRHKVIKKNRHNLASFN